MPLKHKIKIEKIGPCLFTEKDFFEDYGFNGRVVVHVPVRFDIIENRKGSLRMKFVASKCCAIAKGEIDGATFFAYFLYMKSNCVWAWHVCKEKGEVSKGERCAISQKLYTVAKVEGINLNGR